MLHKTAIPVCHHACILKQLRVSHLGRYSAVQLNFVLNAYGVKQILASIMCDSTKHNGLVSPPFKYRTICQPDTNLPFEYENSPVFRWSLFTMFLIFQFILSGSTDGRIHIWNADTGFKVCVLNGGHVGPVQCVQVIL